MSRPVLVGALLALTSASALAQTTYYVEPQAAVNVGLDGTTTMTALVDVAVTAGATNLNRAMTNTTAPTGTVRWRVGEGAADTRTGQEFFRAYTPTFATVTTFAANATAYADFYMRTTGGTSCAAKATLYEYSDTTGIVGAAKGTTAGTACNTGVTARQTMNNASLANAQFTIAAGNRLLVVYSFDLAATRPAYLWGQGASATPSGYQSFTVTTVAAVNSTAAGLPTAAASGCTGLAMRAPYTNDSNGNNTLSYRYRTPSGTGGWSAPFALAHSASPYAFTISGLTWNAAYDVEVTYLDADGVTGTAVQTVANVVVGASCTGAGTLSVANAAGATPSLALSAPYAGDGNANNTGSCRYRISPAGAWVGPTALAHATSPYAATLSGLTCGTAYDLEFTWLDADGLGTGTAVQTVTMAPTNCTTPAAPTALANSCSQVTASAAFTGDANANGSTAFERGASATGPWTAVIGCAAVVGASPRTCVDTGVAASTAFWYRTTVTDADGVSGANPAVSAAAVTTPSCSVPAVTPGAPVATTASCSQINVSAGYTGDTNGNSTTTVSWGPSVSGPWTAFCSNLIGASPRACNVTGLANVTNYWFKVDFADPDNVPAPASQIIGPAATFDCRVAPGLPTATVDTCTQITVRTPWSLDWNGSSTTAFARGASATGPWTGVAGCGTVGGASPRTCVDSPLVASTAYYYQVTFTDLDGVNGTTPQVAGPYNTGVCAGNLTLAGTPQPAAANVAAGGAGTYVGKLTLTSTSGTVTVTQVRFGNTGTGLPGVDLLDLILYDDANGNGVYDPLTDTTVVGTATWSAALARYVVSGLSYAVTAPTARTLFVTLDVSTSAMVGDTFAMNVAAADVVVGAPSLVTGGPVAGNAFTIAAAPGQGGTSTTPMVVILNPSEGATVSGTFRLQVQVHNPGGAALTGLALSKNAGADLYGAYAFNLATDVRPAYGVGANAAVYETTLAWPRGSYALKVRATNAGGASTSGTVVISVNAAGVGDGNLLVRDNGSQLCLDCHAIATHSSQSTSYQYGSWAMNCRNCHQPHSTRNIFLVREQIATPNSGGKAVAFYNTTGAAPNSFATSTGPAVNGNGPCEVCHTKTSNAPVNGTGTATFTAGGTSVTGTGTAWTAALVGQLVRRDGDPETAWTLVSAVVSATQLTLAEGYRGASGAATYKTRTKRYRNTGTELGHYTGTCTGCHGHANGFAAGESSGATNCSGCHGAIWDGMTGVTAVTSKHSLGNVLGTNDSFTDTAVTWGNPLSGNLPAARSCVNMCHDDHVHNLPPATTHEYSVYLNASSQAARAATSRTATDKDKTDYANSATGGLCLSCHTNPVDAAHPALGQAAFQASAHNYTASDAGTWGYTMHDGSIFSRNCTKCHASAAEAVPNAATLPISAVHFSSNQSLLAGTTNPAGVPASYVCYKCHGNGTTGANYSGKDLATQVAKTSNHPANADAVHNSVTEQTTAAFGNTLGVTGRHANCLDCHDPHEAKAGTHVQGTAFAGGQLQGAWGAKFGGTLAAWAVPTTANFTKTVMVAGTDLEATLCFKCHSAYYGALPNSPSATPAFAETDQAREFNPANPSFHPVLASNSATVGNTGNLIAPWARTSLMTCTDCHESNATADPNGPHGSTAGFILKGPNTTWGSGVLNSSTGMPAGTFCANCHNANFTGSRFPGHTNGQHNFACTGCHVLIPHGSGHVGLLVSLPGGAGGNAVTDAAPYVGGTVRVGIFSYPANNTTNWDNPNCGCDSVSNGH